MFTNSLRPSLRKSNQTPVDKHVDIPVTASKRLKGPLFGKVFRRKGTATMKQKQIIQPIAEAEATNDDVVEQRSPEEFDHHADPSSTKLPTIEELKQPEVEITPEFCQSGINTKDSLPKDCCAPDTRNLITTMIGTQDDGTSRQNNDIHHLIAGEPRLKDVDEEVESTVNYLEKIKNKRHARKMTEEDQVETPIRHSERGQSDKIQEKSAQEIIDDLLEAKLDLTKERTVQVNNNTEFQCRVNAVSDEDVDMSDASSSIINDKVSFFTADTDTVQVVTPTTQINKGKFLVKNVPSKPPTKPQTASAVRSKKSILPKILPKRAPVRAVRRKEEDSVCVSAGNKSFDDDLSVAFAPAVGKWLW
jgi:hypothetical protein